MSERNKNIYIMHNDYAEIIMKNNFVALIDLEDVGRAFFYSWHAEKHENNMYAKSNMGRLHRFVMQISDPNIIVDHINGNGLDNRKSNLRIVTASENICNQKNRKRQMPQCIYFDEKCNGYKVQISRERKIVYCKMFRTIDEAIMARDAFLSGYNLQNNRVA